MANSATPRFPIADVLTAKGEIKQTLHVRLSAELVHLLSDQMYQSPTKAIEELVVNSFDADAAICRVYVPSNPDDPKFIVVFDDGHGMSEDALVDLWHIGRSNKRTSEVEARTDRKQIGKFGIGKLATYAVANKITYITRHEDVCAVTLDFRSFKGAAEDYKVPVEIRRLREPNDLRADGAIQEISTALGLDATQLSSLDHWTFTVLEDLKPKVSALTPNRLRWVLSTAMPLRSDFRLFLNGNEVKSSKEDLETLISFSVGDLPKQRIKSLAKATGEAWRKKGQGLIAPSFPSGVSGTVIVTKESLHAGKSADLGRSNGFFIRVRERLINEANALFDLKPLAFQTFNRFRADVVADDLDLELKAPRENVEESELKLKFQAVLGEIYYEARSRYEKAIDQAEKDASGKNEHERNYVNARLVERPLADVLVTSPDGARGGEADDSWFYLDIDKATDVRELARRLYQIPRTRYLYTHTNAGRSARLVRFDPDSATFYINADHDLVRAHSENPRVRVLLEDMVTAEALLEVYLREHDIAPHVIGEVLERRDTLLRSLANDHPYSLETIQLALRSASADANELEIALVAALRAMGFVAAHVSNADEPDGIARFVDYPGGETTITLEAKSSGEVPSLGSIDFAGLRQHVDDRGADGCLLLAPAYPGQKRAAEYSAAAKRAAKNRISCWTIDDLARVVGFAEARNLNARHILGIVSSSFAPSDVKVAVDELLSTPSWDQTALFRAIVQALRDLEGRVTDSPRTVGLIAGEVSRLERFRTVTSKEIEKALIDLSASSQGGINVTAEGALIVHISIEELTRRLGWITNDGGTPRRPGTFRRES